MTAPPPLLLTIEEVAELCQIPVATLRYYRTRDRGEGPTSFKIGRHVRYRREDVEAWLDARYRATRSASPDAPPPLAFVRTGS